jgi:hypothetical protein
MEVTVDNDAVIMMAACSGEVYEMFEVKVLRKKFSCENSAYAYDVSFPFGKLKEDLNDASNPVTNVWPPKLSRAADD